jgi:hypothetical protein
MITGFSAEYIPPSSELFTSTINAILTATPLNGSKSRSIFLTIQPGVSQL